MGTGVAQAKKVHPKIIEPSRLMSLDPNEQGNLREIENCPCLCRALERIADTIAVNADLLGERKATSLGAFARDLTLLTSLISTMHDSGVKMVGGEDVQLLSRAMVVLGVDVPEAGPVSKRRSVQNVLESMAKRVGELLEEGGTPQASSRGAGQDRDSLMELRDSLTESLKMLAVNGYALSEIAKICSKLAPRVETRR